MENNSNWKGRGTVQGRIEKIRTEGKLSEETFNQKDEQEEGKVRKENGGKYSTDQTI